MKSIINYIGKKLVQFNKYMEPMGAIAANIR